MPLVRKVNLNSLNISNFRNLKSVELKVGVGLNIFVGPNGHGKTNLLDAISLASQLRPLRLVRSTQDLILLGSEYARLEAQFDHPKTLQVGIYLDSQGKKVKINSKPTRNTHALNEKLALVSFVPEDLSAILSGASLRRRLLDQLSASLYPNYICYYRDYDRVLRQRNRLLKDPLIDQLELESFTQLLSNQASQLENLRLKSLEQLAPLFEQNLHALSSGKLTAKLNYKPSSQGDLKASLKSLIKEERFRKSTLLGPHLDDLEITLNSQLARYTASRGQSRLIVLAFKMAQLQAVFNSRSLSPILLLDDVIGELDLNHASELLKSISQLKAQTFVTTTHLSSLFENWGEFKQFRIHDGSLD